MVKSYFKCIYFILIIISYSCREEVEKLKRNENGILVERKVFKTSKDSFPFLIVKYFEDGHIKDSSYYNKKGLLHGFSYGMKKEEGVTRRANYVKGKLNGTTRLSFSNGLSANVNYCNDLMHGVTYYYNNDTLERRRLCIGGIPFSEELYRYYEKGDTIVIRESRGGNYNKISYYNRIINCDKYIIKDYAEIESDTIIHVLGISKYCDGKLLYEESYGFEYPEIFCKDTVKGGETIDIRVLMRYPNLKLYSNEELKKTRIKVELYELDMLNYPPMFKSDTVIYGNYQDYEIGITINAKCLGQNVIMGRVNLLDKDSVVTSISFFEDFYVSPR